jgi:HEAT repeat protein
MSIIPKLASSLNRRDEVPNQELAKQIAVKKDKKAVQELVDNLNNKSKDIQNDCIKVLYEIGELNPSLISDHAKELIALLDSKNNRLQWGAMAAINTITLENPAIIYASLVKIIAAADRGSVITKDHGVNILIKLCSIKKYTDNAFTLLIEQLLSSPENQLPMYAEKAIPVVNDKNKALFIKALTSRLDDIEKDTKRKRVEKVIRKFSGK